MLHYNILDGFRGETWRIDSFIEFLKRHPYDLLAFNEYRTQYPLLSARLAELGYCHNSVNTAAPSANRCSFFSRLPFEEISSTSGFRSLHIRMGGLEIVSYHASSYGVEPVLREADALLSGVKECRNLLIIGDFNSLSPREEAKFRYHRPPGEIRGRYLENGAVSYNLIRSFEQNGLTDLDQEGYGENQTVPTGIPRPGEGDFRARIDYAFGRFDGAYGASSRVLHDDCFHLISDHFPLHITVTGGTTPALLT